jgi:hypothetical protein
MQQVSSTTIEKDQSVSNYRFIVDIKTGPTQTAVLQFQNLIQLAKQNSIIQTKLQQQQQQTTTSSTTKKRKRQVDDEDEEDDNIDVNKEIDLESSDGETTEDSSSDGEIKFGEESKQGEEPKRKRLKKTKQQQEGTILNPMNLALRNEEELDWDILQERNSHISRLGSVISNIESRERSLKNNLLKKTVQKKGGDYVEKGGSTAEEEERVGRAGDDFYVYSSDDSFMDDTEYNDYLLSDEEDNIHPLVGSTRKASDFYVVSKVGHGGNPMDDVYMDTESEEEFDNHGLIESKIPAASTITAEDTSSIKKKPRKQSIIHTDDASDEPMEPEFDELIEALKKKAVTLEKTSFTSIPHELDEELYYISLLREKYYKRGVPKKLISRLNTINGLRFKEKTIKDRLKLVLTKFGSLNVTKDLDELRNQLKNSLAEDMKRSLQNKRDRDVKAKKEVTNEDYNKLDFDQLKQKMLETEGVRLTWSKKSSDLMMKMGQMKEQWIEKENATRKLQKNAELLDSNEELSKFFKDLEKEMLYNKKNSNLLFNKYKAAKEKEEKKDGEETSTPAKDESTSTTGTKKKETKKKESSSSDKPSTSGVEKSPKKVKKAKETTSDTKSEKSSSESKTKKKKKKTTTTTTTSGTTTTERRRRKIKPTNSSSTTGSETQQPSDQISPPLPAVPLSSTTNVHPILFPTPTPDQSYPSSQPASIVNLNALKEQLQQQAFSQILLQSNNNNQTTQNQ